MINEAVHILFQTRMSCISYLIKNLLPKKILANRRGCRQEPVQIEIKMFLEVKEIKVSFKTIN